MQPLYDLVQRHYREWMLETISQRQEIGGGIREGEFTINTGDKTRIDQFVEPGYEADFHTHPPISVLRTPVHDVHFLPPSAADVYTSLINGLAGRHTISFVLSVEYIYMIKITPKALKIFGPELERGLSSDDLTYLHRTADFILKPKIGSRGGFLGFKPSKKFPELSRMFCGGDSTTKINMTAKSLQEATMRYLNIYRPFGIIVELVEPINKLRKKLDR